MKNVLLASLLVLGLISCKKETPEPTPVTPVTPATFQENYVVIVGDGHTSTDTIRFPHLRGGYITGDTIDIGAQDTTGYATTSTIVSSMAFLDLNCQTGSRSLTQNTDGFIIVGSTIYEVDAVTLTITSIGPAGGFINGNYSGTFKRSTSPNPIVTVSGKFSVKRN